MELRRLRNEPLGLEEEEGSHENSDISVGL